MVLKAAKHCDLTTIQGRRQGGQLGQIALGPEVGPHDIAIVITLPVRHWRVYTEGRACSRCLPIA